MNLEPYEVDEKGILLLEALEADAKVSTLDLARQLGISEKEVQDYIIRFEHDQIIVRYSTHINWERILRDEVVRAFIEVSVTPQRGLGFDGIAEEIYRFSEVSSVILLSGGYDLLVEVEGPSLRFVALFVAQKLSTIQGVSSTVTHFRLKTYKENKQILVGKSESKRLPFSF